MANKRGPITNERNQVKDYEGFIDSKSDHGSGSGFAPVFMPEFLFPFQRYLVEWATRRGRSAILADCGLGKSPMQLTWAENIVRKTNGRVLVLTPLAVGAQTLSEAEKFGIEAQRSSDGSVNSGAKIVITNYEKLHKFNASDFAGVVCDESSILKNFDGATRDAIVDFMRTIQYRLLCTATAAPNDYVELGNSAEALGEIGFQDMVSKFFKKETSKDYLGWGRTKYRMRPHAEKDFWRWVCSWARAVRKPSDLGYSDERFILPPLIVNENLVDAKRKADGMLFDLPAMTLEDQREERRRTIPDRCERVAELIGTGPDPAVAWCHLNDEGDLIQKLIPGSEQVSGDDSDERKEELFKAFSDGQLRVLVTKPILAGFGLNWQHCCRQTFFPSHSFEQYYQSVRRCWRFGQTRPVTVDIVASSGSAGIRANLQKKSDAADAMFENLVSLMNDSLGIKRVSTFKTQTEAPSWLALNKSSQTSTRRTTAIASK
jgi:hypothetical protein